MNEQTLQTKLNSKSIGYFLWGFCLVILVILAWYSIPKICAQIELETIQEQIDDLEKVIDNRSIEFHRQWDIISWAQAMQVKLHEANNKDRETVKQLKIKLWQKAGFLESK